MAGFIEDIDQGQSKLFPERLEDWVGEDHLVRIVDLFVEQLDLSEMGFDRTTPARTGRPGYHPAVLLKLFVYGYLNQVPSSRRLEREAGRNVELMGLSGRLPARPCKGVLISHRLGPDPTFDPKQGLRRGAQKLPFVGTAWPSRVTTTPESSTSGRASSTVSRPDVAAASEGAIRRPSRGRRWRPRRQSFAREGPGQRHHRCFAMAHPQMLEPRIASQTASATSCVVASPPTSGSSCRRRRRQRSRASAGSAGASLRE